MQSFSERVLAWFEIHGRKHLPWQQNVTAYKTWISEIMLQQTQVVTVIPYFNRFIASFPNIIVLANASQDEVLTHWAGLGYYSRARNLHKAAQIIRDNYDGVFPNHIDDVIQLPGIGKSTAAAILSLSSNQRHAILDGNVKRVLSRHQMINGLPNQTQTLKKQWEIAEQFTPNQHCNQYTQAMMDLGAMICTRSKPRCQDCPVQVDCLAHQHHCTNHYPNKKPQKTLPEKSIIMLIITDGQRIYLEKRPENGIWGGLWSLPELSEIDRIENYLEEYNYREKSRCQQTIYIHTFTHYRLYITPVVIQIEKLDSGYEQKTLPTLALPTPVKRILAKL